MRLARFTKGAVLLIAILLLIFTLEGYQIILQLTNLGAPKIDFSRHLRVEDLKHGDKGLIFTTLETGPAFLPITYLGLNANTAVTGEPVVPTIRIENWPNIKNQEQALILNGMSGSPVCFWRENGVCAFAGGVATGVDSHPLNGAIGLFTPIQNILYPDKAFGIQTNSIKQKDSNYFAHSNLKPSDTVAIVLARDSLGHVDAMICTTAYTTKDKFYLCAHKIIGLPQNGLPLYKTKNNRLIFFS